MEENTTQKKEQTSGLFAALETDGLATTPAPEIEGVDDEGPESFDDLPGLGIDDDTEDYGGFFSDPDDQGGPSEAQPTKASIKAQARLLVAVMDTVSANGASIYGGQPSKRYRFDEEEKSDLIEAAAAYIEATDFKMNPHVNFFFIALSVIAVKGYMAHQDRQSAQQVKTFQAKREKYYDEASKAASEGRHVPGPDIQRPKSTRTIYKIDAHDYYTNEGIVNGDYIKKADRTEKPRPDELAIIKDMKAAGKSWGEINEELKRYNGVV